MIKHFDGALYVGPGPDSETAERIIKGAGLSPKIIICREGECDFDPPMLISSLGVFDGLDSITWYVGTIKPRM